MNQKTVKLSTVVLNFPAVVAVFIVYAKAIYMAMYENPLFAALTAKLTGFYVDITALEVAEAGFKMAKPTHTASERDEALEKVKADLRSLRNDVQELASANPSKAESIIASSGMATKEPAVHGKRKNSARDGVETGSVELTAEGAGPHEWRMSTNEKDWTLLHASLKSKTIVTSLTPGATYYFQNRKLLTNDEKSEWSQSVKMMVR